MTMVENFRDQAQACGRLGSPMYAALLDRVADDIAAGGVSRSVLAGHEDHPGPSALALRLMGSVHRLVLERRAGPLAAFYSSVGGTWDLTGGWAAFESVLDDQGDQVREWLDRPPQTNEVGRATALMGGLLRIGEQIRAPVRLMEVGSSGGLLLRADRFGYTDEHDMLFGDATSVLVLRRAWQGRHLEPWPGMEIVERLGCDSRPVDVGTTEGRLTLTSYVWPDQSDRLERLRGAFAVTGGVSAEVRRQDAVSFVQQLELVPGTTTVLWHSVMWQYLSEHEQQSISRRVEELGSAATHDMAFAHLALEPVRRTPGAEHEFLVVLTLWPTGQRRILGTSAAHGIPSIWE